MDFLQNKYLLSIFFILINLHVYGQNPLFKPKTNIGIQGAKWTINNVPTLEGKQWRGYVIEGLLPNARMVQGIFDDLNPETRDLWKYEDTGKWDPDRNTREFISAMDDWYAHGLLAFTINLQGGSPYGYSQVQPWINSAIDENGNLRPAYMERLSRIIEKADDLGMVVILGIYYFGQDEKVKDEAAVISSIDKTIDWLFDRGYRNVIIEIANESDNKAYDHEILKPDRITELIKQVQAKERNGYRYLVSTSFNGGTIPTDEVIKISDYVLIHGNGVKNYQALNNMANTIRNKSSYTPKPIVNNEDDHFDFDKPYNNFVASISTYVSWGFFDYRMKEELFEAGYQSVPVDWSINSPRKKGFFNLLKEMTGGNP